MPTRFQQRVNAHLRPVIDREHSTMIQLKNGSDLSIPFSATLRLHEYDAVTDIGLQIKIVRRDFYLDVSDCVIDGFDVVPSRGMYVIDDEGIAREIVRPNDLLPAVELEPGGYRYIVHTQEVEGLITTS